MAPIAGNSKTTKTLWQRFGVFVKDPRVKVIFYPAAAVLAVILAAVGNFLWTEYGPGDIHLAVQVRDKSGTSLKGATVGFGPPVTGGYQSQSTDPLGRASFTIPHANMGSKITLNVVLDNYQPPPVMPSLVLDKKNPEVDIELQSVTIKSTNPTDVALTQIEPVTKKTITLAARPPGGTKSSKGSAFSARARGAATKNVRPNSGMQPVGSAPTIAKVVPPATTPPAESDTAPSFPDWIDASWGLEVKNKQFTLIGPSLRCAATMDQSVSISRSQHHLILHFEQSITTNEKDVELDIQCTDLAQTKEWDVHVPMIFSQQGQDSLSFTANMEQCHGYLGINSSCKIPGGRGRLTGTIRRVSNDQVEVEFPGGTFVLGLGQ